MAIKLPAAFVEKMRGLLGEAEFEAFADSYGEERHYGLRSNPLKLSPEELKERVPFRLSPVPWAPEGFYYGEGDRPGKHPYYHAGLYYIQEPSAMAPVELLDVQPGDRVLDLCAAPGGKTTQIAGKLRGTGLIVTNDNNAERVRALAKNVELYGIRNALVLNETPDRLAARWPGFFHKILIDAPCSGEGMFRKDEDMARQWEKHSVEKCSLMQREILQQAAALLAPGGRLVYSTCTFSPEENECSIARFLRSHPEFRVVPVEPAFGFAPGRPDWCAQAEGMQEPDGAALETAGTLRLWPHRIRGEGHYVAVLEKENVAMPDAAESGGGFAQGNGREPISSATRKRKPGLPSAKTAEPGPEAWEQFTREHLRVMLPGVPVYFGENLYLGPEGGPPLDGLKASRPGWFAGAVRKGRFEPSHALAMGHRPGEASRVLSFASDSDDLVRYLKGETLFVEEEEIVRENGTPAKGYVLVCAGEFPVGWGKWSGGMLKNEYPPAWRWI
ncbi:RsmB/NOP family class I SAM-dependent RNA methyltransferase [Gorillibacterium sp. sgz5001074]|uniref:RsmB/NOP family class I SAM-dependent RNA methyltransferase n=1 Tax=Gorillibacterium sp. sgz5001074 TaxID=3446695 RepID=UPI003F6645B1